MATYSWVGGSASWASTLFWTVGGTSNGSVPGTADIASIAAAGVYSVQAQGVGAAGLNLTDPSATLVVSGAGLVVNGGVLANNITAVSVVDDGTIAVAAGGQLQIGGAIAGPGIITLGAGAGLLLNATTTTGALAGIQGTAGTLSLRGTLDNTGTTLSTAQFGNIVLQGSVVKGGTITVPSGVLSTSLSPQLQGVAIVGGLLLASGSLSLDSASTVQPLSPGGTATISVAGGAFSDFNPGVLDHVLLSIAGTVGTQATLFGTLGPVAAVQVGAGTGVAGLSVVANQGSIVTAGGTLSFGTGFANSGTLAAIGGAMMVPGPLTGAGMIVLSKAGVVELQKSYGQQSFQFLDNTGTLKLDFPAGAAPSTVLGFINNPTIELVANPATALTLSGNTLTASNGGLTLARFILPDMPAGAVFAETVDANSDTFITAHQPAAVGQPVTFTWAPLGQSTDWTAGANWSGNFGYGSPGAQAAPPNVDTAIVYSGILVYAPTLLANVNLQMPTFVAGNQFAGAAEVDFRNVELSHVTVSAQTFYGDTLSFAGSSTLDSSSSINIDSTAYSGSTNLTITVAADTAAPGIIPSFVNDGTISAAVHISIDGYNTSSGVRITGAGNFVNNGTITGLYSATGPLMGTGAISLIPGTSSSLLGAVGAGQTITMSSYSYTTHASYPNITVVPAKLELGDPADFAGRIVSFGKGTITLDNMLAAESYYANGTLGLSNGMTFRIDLPLQPGGVYVTHDPYNTLIISPCFAAGTRIATPDGEVAVEQLRPGDVVLRADGRRRPVVWVGHRWVDCTQHPRSHDVWPVRVCRDAFGVGAPVRDLLLSPDHAVFVEGMLVPVRYLINGATIRQEAVAEVTYFHVELAAHAVLLANGLACESYLDTGNRHGFANGGAAVGLHADFARGVWAAKACAPLVVDGARLVAVREFLLARALERHAIDDDPDLMVMGDGVLLALRVEGDRVCCRLPGVGSVRICSRGWVPAQMLAASDDARRLGIAVTDLWIDGVAVGLDDARLGSGWHESEGGFRWTDGDAVVAGATTLEFRIAVRGRYWRQDDVAEVAWHG